MSSILSEFERQKEELKSKEMYLNKEKMFELPIDIFNKALEHQLKKDGKGIEILDLKKCQHCGRKFQTFCICPESDINFQKTLDEVREVSKQNYNNDLIKTKIKENEIYSSKEELLGLSIEDFNILLIKDLKKFGYEYKIPELKTCECGRKYGVVCICKQNDEMFEQKIKEDEIYSSKEELLALPIEDFNILKDLKKFGYDFCICKQNDEMFEQKIKEDLIFDITDDNGLKSDEKFFDSFSFYKDETTERLKSELHSQSEMNEFERKHLLKPKGVESQQLTRMSGQSTRLIDIYVQQIFDNPGKIIDIEDHFVSDNIKIQAEMNQQLLLRILKRIKSEHINSFDNITYMNNLKQNKFSIRLVQ